MGEEAETVAEEEEDDNVALRTVALVAESWKDARRVEQQEEEEQGPSFEEEIGLSIFLALFQLEPKIAKKVFGYGKKKTIITAEKLKQDGILNHAVRMVDMLHKVLTTLEGPPEVLFGMLQDVGRRHVRYGVKKRYIDTMGDAIIAAMKQRLGPDYWSDELEEAWEDVYEILSNNIIKGMEKHAPTPQKPLNNNKAGASKKGTLPTKKSAKS